MHTEEELVALQSALANSATLVGFYGYGEFTTFGANMRLLNQSMTVTTVGEVLAA